MIEQTMFIDFDHNFIFESPGDENDGGDDGEISDIELPPQAILIITVKDSRYEHGQKYQSGNETCPFGIFYQKAA